jgi:hypothetical protein
LLASVRPFVQATDKLPRSPAVYPSNDSSSARVLQVFSLSLCCSSIIAVTGCTILVPSTLSIMAYVTVKILDLDTSISRWHHFKVEEEGGLSWLELKTAFPDSIGVLYFDEKIDDWVW